MLDYQSCHITGILRFVLCHFKRSSNYLIAVFRKSDMANTLDPMDLKQIITLHLDGISNRRIASILGISRNTVNTYMQLFSASDHPLGELLELDAAALSELFTSHTTVDTVRHNELMLYLEQANQSRTHPGFTFQHHYQQYFGQARDPYS